jgi:hypothetical protein
MNLIKSPPKKTNRNRKEWGSNAKLKNKKGDNINWFKGKIKKNQAFHKRNKKNPKLKERWSNLQLKQSKRKNNISIKGKIKRKFKVLKRN